MSADHAAAAAAAVELARQALHPLRLFLALAEAEPDAPAVFQGARAVNRAGLLAMAGSLAAGLAREVVGPGDHVLVNTPNSPEMVALIPAIWSLGAVPMFLSAKSPQAHLDGIRARFQPRLTVDAQALAALPVPRGELGAIRPEGGEDASVVFTSGSSGLPKGVVQKGATLSDGMARIGRTLGYQPGERLLVAIPFAHDYGWGQMLSVLAGGHSVVLPETEALPAIAQAINAHRPTVFAGVPSLYAALLFGISGFELADTTSLRLLTSTGSAFHDSLYEALSARVPQGRILRNYGLTETYRGCCRMPEDAAPPGSVGRPVEGVEIVIVDETGARQPPGSLGEVVHRGAGVFDRYLDDSAATAAVRRMVDGLPAVFTGDMGVLDTAGFLTLAGRRDRLVKSMDIRTNLNDVEAALADLPGLAEVAVLAEPHIATGVALIAFATAPGGETATTLRRAANRALPAHMRPREVILLDTIPRTPLGKVDYQALKAMRAGKE